MTYYTDTQYTVEAGSAASMAVKIQGHATENFTAADGVFTIGFAVPGRHYWQTADSSGNVLEEGVFDVVQKLATAPRDYDPRSLAKRTLEALDDKIAGRALTIQQSKISIGDRSIEYINSIDELLRWREHFARLVAKEEGHGMPTAQVFVMRRPQ